MQKLIITILLAKVVCGQIQNLATTGDGAVVYFDTALPSFDQDIAVAAAQSDDVSWMRHVEEFRVPLPPQANALPGTHWIFVDPKGKVWGSENWSHNIWTLDPTTKDFKRVIWNVQEPINSPMGGNYSLDEEGNIWRTREGEVSRISGVDGRKVEAIKTKKFGSTYGSAMSWDHRYFGGGAWPRA